MSDTQQKFLDQKGVEYLWSKISMQDYPNNETLISVINAIDETKADKSEIKQSDWNQNDSAEMDYIKNKPFGEVASKPVIWDGEATFASIKISGEDNTVIDGFAFSNIFSNKIENISLEIENDLYEINLLSDLPKEITINNVVATLSKSSFASLHQFIITSLEDLTGTYVKIESLNDIIMVQYLDDKYISPNIVRMENIPDINNLATRDEIITDYNQLSNRPVYYNEFTEWIMENQVIDNNLIILELPTPLNEGQQYGIMIHSESNSYRVWGTVNEEDSSIIYINLNDCGINLKISCNTNMNEETGLYQYVIESDINDIINLEQFYQDIQKLPEYLIDEQIVRKWEIPDEIITDYNQLSSRPVYHDSSIEWIIEGQVIDNNLITLELSTPLNEGQQYEIMIHSEFSNYPVQGTISEEDNSIICINLNDYGINLKISCNTNMNEETGLYQYVIESNINDTIDLKCISSDIFKLEEYLISDDIARKWDIPIIDNLITKDDLLVYSQYDDNAEYVYDLYDYSINGIENYYKTNPYHIMPSFGSITFTYNEISATLDLPLPPSPEDAWNPTEDEWNNLPEYILDNGTFKFSATEDGQLSIYHTVPNTSITITQTGWVTKKLEAQYISNDIARVQQLPEIDSTLSAEGAAADAAAVGKAIASPKYVAQDTAPEDINLLWIDTSDEVGTAANPKTEIILKSSTADSTKQFRITINDDGILTATEIG